MTEKSFKVTYLWGEAPEPEQEGETYSFATQAELDAFKEGVQAAEGWLGYEEVEEGYVHPSDEE